jgi:hypothetical protein
LFAAGLIAGGSIGGLILAALVGFEVDQKVAIGTKYWAGLANSSIFGLVIFLAMAGALFAVGRKKLE